VSNNRTEPGAELAATVAALAAMASEHRLAALRALITAGSAGLSAGRLAEVLGLPPSSLSHHLDQLLRAGLVERRRCGRLRIYAPCFDRLERVIAYLMRNCCAGAQPLPPPSPGVVR
jgi:ArsR family transcriptional regulator